MDNALYVTISRQSGLVNKLEVSSNNLANANTSGFKVRSTEFHEFIAKDMNDKVSFSAVKGTNYDNAVGNFQKTGGTLDLALVDPNAYFMVAMPNGGAAFTRSGSFSTDSEGALINSMGYHVLSNDGGDVVIPERTVNLVVSREGDIIADNIIVGRIGVFHLQNSYEIENLGDSLIAYNGAIPSSSVVIQGSLEESNTNSIKEISNLMGTQRRFEETTNLSNLIYDLQRSSIKSLISGD